MRLSAENLQMIGNGEFDFRIPGQRTARVIAESLDGFCFATL